MPSRDFAHEDLFSSPTMSMHSSTHSSQMNTVGPAMSLRTSCWLLPQNEQYSVFLESPVPTLLISVRRPDTSPHSRNPAGQTRLTHDRGGQARAGAKGGGASASSIIEESSENPRPAWVFQLPERFGLDLAGALARHREPLADLFTGLA